MFRSEGSSYAGIFGLPPLEADFTLDESTFAEESRRTLRIRLDRDEAVRKTAFRPTLRISSAKSA